MCSWFHSILGFDTKILFFYLPTNVALSGLGLSYTYLYGFLLALFCPNFITISSTLVFYYLCNLLSTDSHNFYLHSPAAPASALYPATAARQGGSVAASLVDSSEFRTADKNKIEIIPACFLSAHALSMGWEWSVRAVALGVGDCCQRRAWLLKYIIYVMLFEVDTKSSFYSSSMKEFKLKNGS